MSKRKSYSASYKLKAVERAENLSKEEAAREFQVDAKRIRVWCSQKDQLKALKKATRKRLDGAGRKPDDVKMEELFEWIVDLRSRHLRVSRRMIRMQAKTLQTMVSRLVAASLSVSRRDTISRLDGKPLSLKQFQARYTKAGKLCAASTVTSNPSQVSGKQHICHG